ncbi:hypothetical protein TrispH2_009311 [Trichoplax sp. H2]|nr:hypothetical protein TrispH2_009311 [Trichoplax sp. H2]|eukprot:RDD37584.1 hypothetical protein TrispH2_009311 [Trichoplax sp. H2]
MKSLVALALIFVFIPAVPRKSDFLNRMLYNGLKPKSSLEIKYIRPSIKENGVYTIFNERNSPYHVYCDFKSDALFVWTLIESFDRNIGVWGSKVSNAWRSQRPYYINAPYDDTEPPHWSVYRMTAPNMLTISKLNTTSHWRTTCNFNDYAQNITKDIERNDYMRNNMVNANIVLIRQYYCRNFNYVIVRGYACVKCYLPFWASTNYHPTFLASHSVNYCGRYKFPDSSPSDFGHYNGYSTKHACSSFGSSTANWWLGGLYQSLTNTML